MALPLHKLGIIEQQFLAFQYHICYYIMVFIQVFIQMNFTPEDFFNVFIRLLSQVFIRDAPGISEKDDNRSKSTKVTKVITISAMAHDTS